VIFDHSIGVWLSFKQTRDRVNPLMHKVAKMVT